MTRTKASLLTKILFSAALPLAVLTGVLIGTSEADAAIAPPFQRMIYVADWGNALSSKAKIDQIMNDSAYMNVDAIMMILYSDYFEAVRDPVNKSSWDTRASWNMLEYAIDSAHKKISNYMYGCR